MKSLLTLITLLVLAPFAQARPFLGQVATDAKGPILATRNVYADKIRELNDKIAANTKDGASYAWRAAHWPKCDVLFRQNGNYFSKNSQLWLNLMNADIAKAVEVSPKDTMVYKNIVVALQQAEAREVRVNGMRAGVSSSAAETMKNRIAECDQKIEQAFAKGLQLGDPSVGSAKSWHLLKKIAAADMAQRPKLLGELAAASKLSPNEVTATLCRGAGFSAYAVRLEVRAAATKEIDAKIDVLATAKPQETHDVMSRIARLINLHDGTIARKWQERAAAIPGTKSCPDNRLLAYTFKKDKTDAELESFVFDLSIYFEPSPYNSEFQSLIEGLAARKARVGDFKGALAERLAVTKLNGKAGNWVEAGDMFYRIGDYRTAIPCYETFNKLTGGDAGGHASDLELGFMRALAGINAGETVAYLNALWTYETPELESHKKLLEWQLTKTPENATLKIVLAKIIAILGGEKPDRAYLKNHMIDLTLSDSNERDSFRLYAPKVETTDFFGAEILAVP